MLFSWAAFVVLLPFGAQAAQFRIQEVEHNVDHILHEYSSSRSYTADGSDAGNAVDAPYWYENIPHQGISAFGPQGYQVFRNVKDFGAQGTSTSALQVIFLNCSWADCTR
jgi:glucan 1,3-beta-glucosidase